MFYTPSPNDIVLVTFIGGFLAVLFVGVVVWIFVDILISIFAPTKTFSYFCNSCGWSLRYVNRKISECPNCRGPIVDEQRR